jgi:hypothetical protein
LGDGADSRRFADPRLAKPRPAKNQKSRKEKENTMKANVVQSPASGKAFPIISLNRINGARLLWGVRFSVVAALLVFGLLLTATGAKAGGCAVPGPYAAVAAHSAAALGPHANDDSLYHPEGGSPVQPASIVGLWHVIYTGTSDDNFPPGGPFPPTPFQFLESLKTWHGDGTEFENAFLPPSGGNICFGVWQDEGRGTVKLHHIGLMFASDGSVDATFTVDETDTVAFNGQSYKGSFDFKLWPPSYDAIGVGKPISEVKGTTAATRINVD